MSVGVHEISYLSVEIIEDKKHLNVILKNGSKISVPDLSEEEIEAAFKAHMGHLETEQNQEKDGQFLQKLFRSTPVEGALATELPSMSFQFSDLGAFPLNGHDEMMRDSPPLPKEVIEKICIVAKAIGGDLFQDVEFVSNCNCFFCQIARSVKGSIQEKKGIDIPHIIPSDLEKEGTHPDWKVEEIGDNLFKVTDRDHPLITFEVSLKDRLSCTCCQERCPHMRAVLES